MTDRKNQHLEVKKSKSVVEENVSCLLQDILSNGEKRKRDMAWYWTAVLMSSTKGSFRFFYLQNTL